MRKYISNIFGGLTMIAGFAIIISEYGLVLTFGIAFIIFGIYFLMESNDANKN